MTTTKRLIERMSSLIIDKECFESLIELVEYKIKQKLTPKQRRMLNKRKKKTESKTKRDKKGKKAGKSKKGDESEESDYDDDDEQFDENEDDENDFEEDEEAELDDKTTEDMDEDDDDDNATKTTENSNEGGETDRMLVKHIDDDGEKGLKLLSTILMIHTNYGFANPTTYQKLFAFTNSRKDHVVSSTLKLLSTYFTPAVRSSFTADQLESFNKTNDAHLDKLKQFCKSGKPKQAKHAVHLIFNNFEKPKNEQILYELYKDLQNEATLKQSKTFITTLVSLGHICYLIPHKVGKEIKEFMSKSIVKDILLQPLTAQLNISGSEMVSTAAAKRKNNLKLAGKWCENEDELPFDTRARIEAIKLVIRWCLGLKSECTNIVFTLKILVKLIKESSSDQSSKESNGVVVSEAEKSRMRSICGSQLIKLAQESCFKPLITAEFFHVLARLIIDPVTNVRDLIIKKLHRGLKSSKLPIYYMSIFALCGFDVNRERKVRVKKLYTALVKNIRLNDAKEQRNQTANTQKPRILPEMCLPYAVSLLAHNTKIDSLKDDAKIKQVKECMSIILDPLLETPDAYQIAYIKKILNKIKTSDDGVAAANVAAALSSTNQNESKLESSAHSKAALQNLYFLNKNLCIICEVFLFHMHSKSSTYLTAKEYQFDVKLPGGFFSVRENGNSTQQQLLDKEIEEQLKERNSDLNKDAGGEQSDSSEKNDNVQETDKENKKRGASREAKKRKASDEAKKKANESEEEASDDNDDDEDNITLSDLKAKKTTANNSTKEANDSKNSSASIPSPTPPPSKRNKLSGNTSNQKETNSNGIKDKNVNKKGKQKDDDEEEEKVEETEVSTTKGRKSTRAVKPVISPNTSDSSNKPKGKRAPAKKEEEKENENSDEEAEEENAKNEDASEEEEEVKKPTRASARKSVSTASQKPETKTNKQQKADEPIAATETTRSLRQK